ncbi:MAG: hypothetical protein H7251_13705 [Acetobacteraceae bacterium]|nr:hypothetical protein [Acetobacteraceae bacterium]
MLNFSAILSDLQAAIARRAARDRTLTVLLVAVWGRIARMGARLERLVALWRAGALPQSRARHACRADKPAARPAYPTAPTWLLRELGYEVVGFGSQLRHLLSDAECQAFLAAVPQAGRILRPLLRMLSSDPLPDVVRKVRPPMPEAAPVAAIVAGVVAPVLHFLEV